MKKSNLFSAFLIFNLSVLISPFANAQYTKLLDFSGTANGSNPQFSNLIQASDGMLYGLTYDGGANNKGVLFQYNPVASSYIIKFDFDGILNGSNPEGSLMQASDGMLYGMTETGGINGQGVLFQFDPSTSTYTNKLNLASTANGANPNGTLMQASDGMLYGMTYGGGTNNLGVLFQYDPATSTFTKKLDFTGTVNNGANPYGSLIQASDGMLYGMTNHGNGGNNWGVLFQYNPFTSIYINKFNFDGTSNGSNPVGSLIQASDGMLYGLAGHGGTFGAGVLFQFNIITDTLIKMFDFDGTTNGLYEEGSLVQANDGMLYGMSNQGGANSKGVLFQYNPATTIFTKMLDFDGATNGSLPRGSLIQASDGMLYGMTWQGGTSLSCGSGGCGTMFKYQDTTTCLAFVNDSIYKDTSMLYTWNIIPNYSSNITSARWYWGDGTDTLALYPSHTYVTSGFYNICVTAYASCGDSAISCHNDSIYKMANSNAMIQVNVLQNLTTSIKTASQNNSSLKIFPNPSNGKINIQLGDVKNLSGVIRLFDLSGRVVYSVKENNLAAKQTITLDLETINISSGTYFLDVVGSNEKIKIVLIKN